MRYRVIGKSCDETMYLSYSDMEFITVEEAEHWIDKETDERMGEDIDMAIVEIRDELSPKDEEW